MGIGGHIGRGVHRAGRNICFLENICRRGLTVPQRPGFDQLINIVMRLDAFFEICGRIKGSGDCRADRVPIAIVSAGDGYPVVTSGTTVDSAGGHIGMAVTEPFHRFT